MARAVGWGGAAALLVVGAVGYAAGAASHAGAAPAVGNAYTGLDVYARVLARIEESYVRPVDQQALVYASLHGMTAALDPYSQFFDPVEWAQLETEPDSPSVTPSTPAPGVLCLRITRFDVHTGDEVAAALATAPAAAGKPPEAVLLDLRGNPGGRLDQAVATADCFLTDGAIVASEGRAPGASHAWVASLSPTDYAGPVRVLVDGGSASAAEVVAGALRDRGRARLIGSATYGKGTVQSMFHFEDGSALKLTDAHYTLPSGHGIVVGLLPDVLVPTSTGAARDDEMITAALRDLGR